MAVAIIPKLASSLHFLTRHLAQHVPTRSKNNINPVFPYLYKVGNVVNKGLCRENQNKFTKKNAFSRMLTACLPTDVNRQTRLKNYLLTTLLGIGKNVTTNRHRSGEKSWIQSPLEVIFIYWIYLVLPRVSLYSGFSHILVQHSLF